MTTNPRLESLLDVPLPSAGSPSLKRPSLQLPPLQDAIPPRISRPLPLEPTTVANGQAHAKASRLAPGNHHCHQQHHQHHQHADAGAGFSKTGGQGGAADAVPMPHAPPPPPPPPPPQRHVAESAPFDACRERAPVSARKRQRLDEAGSSVDIFAPLSRPADKRPGPARIPSLPVLERLKPQLYFAPHVPSIASLAAYDETPVDADVYAAAEPRMLDDTSARLAPAGASEQKRSVRPRRKWTEQETEDLLQGVALHGVGNWKRILADSRFKFNARSAIDLKDRFRTCCPNEYGKPQRPDRADATLDRPRCTDLSAVLVTPPTPPPATEPSPAVGYTPSSLPPLAPTTAGPAPSAVTTMASTGQSTSASDAAAPAAAAAAPENHHGKSRSHRVGPEELAKLGINAPFPKSNRRERRGFSAAEDADLLKGYLAHGAHWSRIRADPSLHLQSRRAIDLRDRFRNRFPERYAEAGFKIRPKAGPRPPPLRSSSGSGGSSSGGGGGGGGHHHHYHHHLRRRQRRDDDGGVSPLRLLEAPLSSPLSLPLLLPPPPPPPPLPPPPAAGPGPAATALAALLAADALDGSICKLHSEPGSLPGGHATPEEDLSMPSINSLVDWDDNTLPPFIMQPTGSGSGVGTSTGGADSDIHSLLLDHVQPLLTYDPTRSASSSSLLLQPHVAKAKRNGAVPGLTMGSDGKTSGGGGGGMAADKPFVLRPCAAAAAHSPKNGAVKRPTSLNLPPPTDLLLSLDFDLSPSASGPPSSCGPAALPVTSTPATATIPTITAATVAPSATSTNINSISAITNACTSTAASTSSAPPPSSSSSASSSCAAIASITNPFPPTSSLSRASCLSSSSAPAADHCAGQYSSSATTTATTATSSSLSSSSSSSAPSYLSSLTSSSSNASGSASAPHLAGPSSLLLDGATSSFKPAFAAATAPTTTAAAVNAAVAYGPVGLPPVTSLSAALLWDDDMAAAAHPIFDLDGGGGGGGGLSGDGGREARDASHSTTTATTGTTAPTTSAAASSAFARPGPVTVAPTALAAITLPIY